jgi:glycerophosphoryl diester phosphodiesterase
VADQTARQVGKCHIDIVGTNDAFRRAPGSKERVPRLAAVLRWAKKRGARLNVEINHYPTEPSFDPTSRFVTAELDAIAASHIPKRLILIQSFLPANLAPARKRGYRTALITFSGSNGQALAIARSEGIPVIEPQWPVDRAFVKRAHAAGRKVIPYTLGKRSELRAAAAAGVDGVISDDPTRARRTLRCFGAGRRYRAARRELAAAQRALKNAKDPAAKRRAAARVKTAQRKVGKTRRVRRRACA